MQNLEGIDKRIYYQLLNVFPDKQVNNLTSINSSLYNEIRQRVSSLEIDTNKYLQNLGFKYTRNRSGSTRYDIDALRRIKTQYKGNLTDIALLLDVSRQRINQLTKKKGSDYPPVWQTTEMTQEQISYCLNMINSEQYKFDNDKIAVRLYKNPSNLDQFAVLIVERQSGIIQCYFSLPSVITTNLIKNGFVMLDALDFEIKKACYSIKSATVDIDNMIVIPFENDSELYSRIYTRARRLGIPLDSYLSRIRVRKADRRRITDAEVKKTLAPYADKENYIHIPASDPQYHRLRNLAQNRGFRTFKEFFEHYGFSYERRRIAYREEDVIEKLKSNYVVEGNKIYISTYDPLYNNLTGYARNRGMRSVSDIIQSWGFERIYLDDLPEDFNPYDWQKDLTDTLFTNEEKLQALIDDMSIEGGKVYIESQTPIYNQLFILAIRKGTTMNALLSEWGFKRIYRADLEVPDQPERSLEALLTDQEKIDILEQLKQIMAIQGSLKRTKIVSEQIERSQTLSQALKKLYDYRCQICGDKNEIPQIIKSEGTPYVEVHHIIPVSEADNVQDDSYKILDSYHNTVVVCPHHHKYIHYHHGGFEEVLETNEETAFIGKNGEKLTIQLNYHITANPINYEKRPPD